jgi:hypothetical protein
MNNVGGGDQNCPLGAIKNLRPRIYQTSQFLPINFRILVESLELRGEFPRKQLPEGLMTEMKVLYVDMAYGAVAGQNARRGNFWILEKGRIWANGSGTQKDFAFVSPRKEKMSCWRQMRAATPRPYFPTSL